MDRSIPVYYELMVFLATYGVSALRVTMVTIITTWAYLRRSLSSTQCISRSRIPGLRGGQECNEPGIAYISTEQPVYDGGVRGTLYYKLMASCCATDCMVVSTVIRSLLITRTGVIFYETH